MSIPEENITQRSLEEVLPESFLGYSKHVILQRAVPDVRDGLKPVHRRIIYAMDELGMNPDKPYSKSARLVGDCMGKYHPHGDSSIYDAAVRMAQPWATRYPLIDGQGNFGSIDGDGAAAMRYTEMRMTPLSQLMTQDIEKNVIPFKPNYDQRQKEPIVLPSPFPNLLVNGGSGIAVGMASNIPPHNLREVVAALIFQIDHPDVTLEQLMERIKGPDFPTGGLIIGSQGFTEAYRSGRGKVIMRGKAVIESGKNGKNLIVITEIPFQVSKSTLAAKIETQAENGKIEGISEVRDESDREGIRLVVECKKDADPKQILKLLYKYTQLQETFGIINLVITEEGTPRVLGLKEINRSYLQHRKEVVIRRTEYELEKAKARAHILEGLVIAINNLDEVLHIIRSSKTPTLAKAGLITRFEFSEAQAQAILDMRLQHLTNLELDGIRKEYADILKLIVDLESILADVNKVYAIIKNELKEIADKYGDDRRTLILPEDAGDDIDFSAFEEPEKPMEVLLTKKGFIKQMPTPTRKSQINAVAFAFKDGDVISEQLSCTSKDTLFFFTHNGKYYDAKAKLVPEGGAKDKGRAVNNLFPLPEEERIVAMLSLREGKEGQHFVFVTRDGQVMRSPVKDFLNARTPEAMGLKDQDEIIKVFLSEGEGDLFLASFQGQAIRFAEAEVNPMGRKSRGVKGMTLNAEDYVVDALLIQPAADGEEGDLITVTEQGYVKRTSFDEYKPQGRAGRGIAIAKIDAEKTGYLVSLIPIGPKEDKILHIIQAGGTVTHVEAQSLKRESRVKSGAGLVNVIINDYIVHVV
ncbi:DNA gyrase subunit A [Desulfitobacterium dehalogenans ATCC 51507]|uniref:DNA topoisomerase (ATP-hydrolyzing) n=1 Tax=Desulfitobacterium dehalogenans (strain ATCC 51507 / DSM 9161 / JW/IU-DC1) TaxID=756499 RepID=I4A978_DESDJ|nr:DNA gyrase subunit A [Desulfitobacterium dehalogenans]AFM00513.1 DNA gyrase subunit A [Desulfitobacterium dehalogenans ATCC 51507]